MKQNTIKKYQLSTIINFVFFVIMIFILFNSLLWLYNSSLKSIKSETNNYLIQSSKMVEIVLTNYANSLSTVTKQISSEYEFILSRIKNDDSTEVYLENVLNTNSENKLDFVFLNLFDGNVINSSVSIYDTQSILDSVVKSKKNEVVFYKEIITEHAVLSTIIAKEKIVDFVTGRHIGDLYAGIILNDNFSIINEVYQLLKVKSLAFIINNKPIASYPVADERIYYKIQNIKEGEIYIEDDLVFRKSKIKIKGKTTSLGLTLITSNSVFKKFESDFLEKIIFLMLFIVMIFFITYKFIKKLIETPLQKLLLFTSDSINNKQIQEYEEMWIEEFNVVGQNFELLISRIKKMNKVLTNLVEKRTNELTLKTDKVTDLLNNAGQGFLSIGRDFLVNDEYSLECELILGKELKNVDIIKLLFIKNRNKIKFFKETILDALNEQNDLTASLILSLLPKEVIVNKRAVQLEYKRLTEEKIMLILTNITDKKKLESKIKNEQLTLKMIVVVVSDSVQFYEIKENYEQFCSDSLLYINYNNTAMENANTLCILIHTFKGLFSQLYMKNTVKKLHKCETELLKLLDENIDSNSMVKQLIISFNLMDCMSEDLGLIISSLGEKFLAENTYIKINEEFIDQLEKKLSSFCSIFEKDQGECNQILNDIRKLKNRTLKHYLSVYPKIVQHLCLSLGKSIYPFEIIGDSNLQVYEIFKPFINSLIHVFRNSCDHGIESKEKRVLLGKNEVGTISCIFKKENDFLFIEIHDDGSGINLKQVKDKIVEYKLQSQQSVDLMLEEEVLMYIFDIHFSTNDEITLLSGRGVGLAAVKKELDTLKGEIEIITQINKGTSFIFKLPIKRF